MIIKVNLDYDMLAICQKFAQQSASSSTNYYKQRNQFDPKLIEAQIFQGKLGEFATYNYLKDKLINLTQPDIKIYSSKNKSFDVDLQSDEYKIHVKTQTVEQAKRFGGSFIFQYNGIEKSGHNDDEVFSPIGNNLVSFVFLDLNNHIAKIAGITNLNYLHKYNLFKLPIKKELQNNKRAVYYTDLQEFLQPEELWAVPNKLNQSFVIPAPKEN